MAHIEHLAIWTADLERLRVFYELHFGARAGARYSNPSKQFQSYFLSFDSGARLELMSRPSVATPLLATPAATPSGYAHLAISVGSRARVDQLTAHLRGAGVPVLDGPRQTGDGHYESVILDPDGNHVEIAE
ncbi:MAG TPA: VOC family protein [Polyangia bacterium]|jgi:lactoylglutathione lyase|nr:VOC family protein [Polyangia bacterium]